LLQAERVRSRGITQQVQQAAAGAQAVHVAQPVEGSGKGLQAVRWYY